MSKTSPTINWPAILSEEEERQEGFRRIGEFLFWFSQLEFTIKARLERALGLPDELAEAVTTPYNFVHLCTVTQTVLLSQHPPEQKPEIERVFNACKRLNDERVRIAHGTWLHLIETGLIVRFASVSKLKGEFYFQDPKTLPNLTAEAHRLMQEVLQVPSAPKKQQRRSSARQPQPQKVPSL